MHFTKITAFLFLTSAAGVLAAPTNTIIRRGAARTFAELSISSGTAGNAEAEAKAVFPTPSDLASVSSDDLDTLKTERETAEDAETDGFNPAIDDATDDATKTALQNGKIKNKVLKLTGEVLALKIAQAQGDDNADKIAEEQKKLDTNIQLDKEAAGQASQTVDFDGN
ncbi:hypothetical protein DTO021D3_8582 [Paecilomyces variotii]|nr:hypothetical protein DTO032I3_5192 [Paecilomyces variotii]KAJ9274565.1 hypothetical protein DTO021D3_8582 [Paecilomyces variotii]KAJ9283827.1 hypothetical protein DTO021C3_8584 [Paecilomyces variotii]KAJ9342297.1 hypothetical protein DTO027B6_5226 [Paecilomyces variotii]KAJ9351558.1 hypothetical protein DTO027B9_6359 [Paecilomyces variotii]